MVHVGHDEQDGRPTKWAPGVEARGCDPGERLHRVRLGAVGVEEVAHIGDEHDAVAVPPLPERPVHSALVPLDHLQRDGELRIPRDHVLRELVGEARRVRGRDRVSVQHPREGGLAGPARAEHLEHPLPGPAAIHPDGGPTDRDHPAHGQGDERYWHRPASCWDVATTSSGSGSVTVPGGSDAGTSNRDADRDAGRG